MTAAFAGARGARAAAAARPRPRRGAGIPANALDDLRAHAARAVLGAPGTRDAGAGPAGAQARTHRLFLALEVPAAQRREIERRAEPLRAHLPRARWARPEALHVTVLFLAAVPAAARDAVRAALAGVAGRAPRRRLALSGLGSFPPRRPARILWIGVDCAPDAGVLHRDCTAAAAACGLSVEAQEPFLPHLTIARCPEPWPLRAVERLAPAFAAPLGPAFEVAEAVLFESHLPRAGGAARHEVLARLPLAGGAPGVAC